MIYVGIILGVLLIALLISPFFVGPGGLLAASATINSPEKLIALKRALLERYLADEAAHSGGHLSNLAWDKRRTFLVNRYVDASRRLDFLRHAADAAKEGA